MDEEIKRINERLNEICERLGALESVVRREQGRMREVRRALREDEKRRERELIRMVQQGEKNLPIL